MGAWGHTALESDEGLDVKDCLQCYLSESYPDSTNITVSLKELLKHLCNKGYIATSSIDFLYDNTAIALCELYFNQKDSITKKPENVNRPCLYISDKHITVSGDNESIRKLFEQICDIRNNVGNREITELWSDSGPWKNHIDSIYNMLQNELSE